jgi:hypothetical protein
MVWLTLWARVAAAEPLRIAVVEIGTAAGSLSSADGAQTRLEWSTGGSLHLGFQGSWNGGPYPESDGDFLYAPEDPDARLDAIRALATLGWHLDDRRVQVGLGLAAGPWVSVSRDAPAYSPSDDSWSTYSGRDVALAAFWITSIRIRIFDDVGVYFATTGDLASVAADGSFGIGWTR